MAISHQMRVPLNAAWMTSKKVNHVRRHSAPDAFGQKRPVSRAKIQEGRVVPTPEPHCQAWTSGPSRKTLLQRATTKFAIYDVAAAGDSLWRAMTPGSRPSSRAGGGEKRASQSQVPNRHKAQEERCSRCTRTEMWAAYDVFRSIDKRGLRKISRQDYSEALGEFPTVDKLRVLKRSGLENRIRQSSKEVTLEEFLRLMWPQATDEDLVRMQYWAKLRDAQCLIHAGNFEGDVKDLRQVFDLLDQDRNHLLEYNELLLILSKQDIQQKMLQAEAHRAEFKGEGDMVEAQEEHNARLEFKKLLYRGKSASSHLDQLLLNEKVFENKLTFDEFCHLIQPKASQAKSF